MKLLKPLLNIVTVMSCAALVLMFSSCENSTNMPMAASYQAGLTPSERDNPRIDRVLRNAQAFDLTGVANGINKITDPPGDNNCEASTATSSILDLQTMRDETPFERISSQGSQRTPISLWATYYYTPVYTSDSGGVALKTKSEAPIKYNHETVSLSHRKWCMAAMEGSVSIRMPDGVTKTYNYSGVGSMQTDCTGYFRGRHRATGRVKFMEVDNVWGYGVRNYSLIPYRTIAVDPDVIPYGSVVYIPEAAGKEIALTDGTKFIHDGYFFAGDTGGAIKNNHIDVFTGNNEAHELSFIQSNASSTFSAEIVHDPEVRTQLENLHRIRY